MCLDTLPADEGAPGLGKGADVLGGGAPMTEDADALDGGAPVDKEAGVLSGGMPMGKSVDVLEGAADVDMGVNSAVTALGKTTEASPRTSEQMDARLPFYSIDKMMVNNQASKSAYTTCQHTCIVPDRQIVSMAT